MAKSNKKSNALNEFLSQIKWGESYTSLVLGIVVVLVAVFLLVILFKNVNKQTQETGSTSINEARTYIVKEGEDLWHISENLYGSGYNWEDLAKANKLSNPDVIEPGTKLTVPQVSVKEKTGEPTVTAGVKLNKITGIVYTVAEGDYLWDIALRAYGDGYKWAEIAKFNNLQNPDLIYTGTKLNLPR